MTRKLVAILGLTTALGACGPMTTLETAGLPAWTGGSGERDGRPAIVARGVALEPHAKVLRSELGNRRVRDLMDGGTVVLEMSASGSRLRLVEADGCRSTRLLDWFSPSLAWADCGNSKHWHTAEARVGIEASLYPLRPGATGRYRRSAVSHTGRKSERVTDCRVTDAVTVDLGARVADAFEVVCDDGRIERTTWYAPGEGPVAYREAHRERGLREAWVLTD
ncbi:MAG: hypothetical protein AAF371_02530 [Pseudomonadota bacterium]